MKIKVETGIPVPKRTVGVRKYPIPDLKVRGSFFVAAGERESIILMKSLRNCITHFKRRFPNRVFELHTVTEGGSLGIRCWRMK